MAGLGLGGRGQRAAAAVRGRRAGAVRCGQASLTLQQRVICSYTWLTPPDSLLGQISAGEAAGVIFITGNISARARSPR